MFLPAKIWFAFVNRCTQPLHGKQRDSCPLSISSYSQVAAALQKCLCATKNVYQSCMWRLHHKPPTIKYDNLDLPGIITKRLNNAAALANIKAGIWSREFFPTTEMSSVFLRNRLAPAMDDAVLNRNNGKISHDKLAEPGPSGINPPKKRSFQKNTCRNKSFFKHVFDPWTRPSHSLSCSTKGTVKTTRNTRAEANLTEKPETAALWDKQNSKQVTTRTAHQKGSKGRLLYNLQEILRRQYSGNLKECWEVVHVGKLQGLSNSLHNAP